MLSKHFILRNFQHDKRNSNYKSSFVMAVKGKFSCFVLPFVVYSLLSVVILWDLLLPGYVLALDMVFTPTIQFPGSFFGFSNDPISLLYMPYNLGLWALNNVASSWIIQKTLLFLVFLLAGLGAYDFCSTESISGKLFAGFIYAMNPFIYVRFMVGHLSLLLAYSVFPFLLKSFIKFLHDTRMETCIRMMLLSTLVIILDSHFVYITAIPFVALLIFKILTMNRKNFLKIICWSAIACLFFLVINFFWIAPMLTFETSNPFISGFTYQDLLAFTSRTWGTGFNIFFTLATLYGFWRFPEGYSYVSWTLPGWQLIFVYILYLAVNGFISSQNKSSNKWIGKGIATASIISLILATGISSTYTAPIFEALFKFLPFFSGMREPQKFLTILVLAYSFFGGYGVSTISMTLIELKNKSLKHRVLQRTLPLIFMIVSLASPFVYSYTQLFGFNGQIRNLEYPSEWYEIKAVINQDASDYRILILPWHLYMHQSWIGRKTANPASDFFDKPFLAGENMEWGGIETQSIKPEQSYTQLLLNNRARIMNLGNLLAPLNVKYIILLKEVDYRDYDFLYNQTDLKVIKENAMVALFENQHETSRFYMVNTARNVTDWNRLIDVSSDEDLLSHLYFIGQENASASIFDQPFQTLNSTKVSTTEYKVEVPERGYVVFSEFYDKNWILNSENPISNLGLVNAFYVEGSGSVRIIYQRFSWLIPYYLISVTTLAVSLTYLIMRIKRQKKIR